MISLPTNKIILAYIYLLISKIVIIRLLENKKRID